MIDNAQLQSKPCPVIFEKPGTGPVLVTQQLTRTAWIAPPVLCSQLIRVAAPFSVASVDLLLSPGVPNWTSVVEFWTGPNRTGVQIGTASDFHANFASAGWFSYGWTGAKPALTADCYLTVYVVGFFGCSVGVGVTAGGTLYLDNVFCAYHDAAAQANEDICFRLWRMP